MSIPGKDREKADLALLIGSGAGEILRSALMNMGQPAVIRGWEVHSIHHRPGAGVTAGYSVTLDRILPNGAHMRVEEYLCASTARLSHPNTPGLVYVSKGDSTFSVWRYPADPELPALFLLRVWRKTLLRSTPLARASWSSLRLEYLRYMLPPAVHLLPVLSAALLISLHADKQKEDGFD